MAKLVVDTIEWGDVVSAPFEDDFPAFDSDYRELTWNFTIDQSFNTFNELQFFENVTIKSRFSNRVKDIQYKNIIILNMVLQSYVRSNLLTPGGGGQKTRAEYKVQFTKEDA